MAVHEIEGVSDRSSMLERLEELVGGGTMVSLCIIDIDGFMDINDRLGYATGDKVIVELGGILRRAAEAVGGWAYRISGDEFAVVMPETSLEEGFLRGEEIRRTVEEHQAAFGLGGEIKLTISCGVASYPRDSKDVDGLARAASAAIYSAKEAGRNRVALPPAEDMVMKSCYYSAASVSRLKQLAARVKKKESELLREALEDLLKRYDAPDR